MKRLAMSTVAAVALLAAAPADAAPNIEFTLLQAAWYNAIGGQSVIYDPGEDILADTVTVSWGTPFPGFSGEQSSYVFEARETPFDEGPNQQFDLGEFTHNNWPIVSGGGIDSVNLRLVGNLTVTNSDNSVDVVNGITFLYLFDHWETPNNPATCANGEPNNQGVNINGCADQVVISSLVNTGIFFVDDEEFTLAIDGFLMNGSPVTAFWTIEEAANTVTLVGSFRTYRDVVDVPEPGTLALLGIGLLGAGVAARRRQAA